ncbi:MAG: hypothetical protein IJA61_01730 [Clostridia bacterium]|nr:hypothetical protein [Clostridia bacterium]
MSYKDTWFENLDKDLLSERLAEKGRVFVKTVSGWTLSEDGKPVIEIITKRSVGTSENAIGMGEDIISFNEYGVVEWSKTGYTTARLKDTDKFTEMWLKVMRESNKDVTINGHTYMEDFISYHKANIDYRYNKRIHELEFYMSLTEGQKEKGYEVLSKMVGQDITNTHQEEMGE